MRYVYPDLMDKYNKYIKNTDAKCQREFKLTISDLMRKPNKTEQEQKFLHYYFDLMPVGNNACLVNRIAWLFEDIFKGFLGETFKEKEFDYSILKFGTEYSNKDYISIAKLKLQYDDVIKHYQERSRKERLDKEDVQLERIVKLENFKKECLQICPNEKELCDILIDLCYSTSKSKQFVWDICGDIIIEHLLEVNGNKIYYPEKVDGNGEFEFAGEQFVLKQKTVTFETEDEIEKDDALY